MGPNATKNDKVGLYSDSFHNIRATTFVLSSTAIF